MTNVDLDDVFGHASFSIAYQKKQKQQLRGSKNKPEQ